MPEALAPHMHSNKDTKFKIKLSKNRGSKRKHEEDKNTWSPGIPFPHRVQKRKKRMGEQQKNKKQSNTKTRQTPRQHKKNKQHEKSKTNTPPIKKQIQIKQHQQQKNNNTPTAANKKYNNKTTN